MKDRILLLSGVGVLVLLAALSVPALLLRHGPGGHLLLVCPVEDSPYLFDRWKLEQIAGDEFLLTYEIRRQIVVRTAYAEYPVTLIGTNSRYPALGAYPLREGSFFTRAAEEGKIKQAVLNPAAAFRLFGSDNIAGRTLRMAGAPWLITGVMDDGEGEDPRVYIPASSVGEDPRSLLVLLSGNRGIDAVYVKNVLKTLGVHETSHLFLDLSRAVRFYGERFTLTLRLFICALFYLFARRQALLLRAPVLAFKKRLKQKYLRELIREGAGELPRKLIRLVPAALAFSGGILCALILFPQILNICLGWGDMPPFTAILGRGDFPAIGAPLLDFYYPDTILFALAVALIVFMLLFESLNPANTAG